MLQTCTAEASSSPVVVPLPPGALPLMADIKVRGEATGIFSSYYDAAQHQWIVQHRRVPPGGVVLPAELEKMTNYKRFSVRVDVVVLHDPHERFEVQYTLSSYCDSVAAQVPNDLYRAQRATLQFSDESFWLQLEQRSTNTSSSAPVPADTRPHRKTCVRVAAPIPPAKDGFTLCGGGFVSDYPVCCYGPAQPTDVSGKLWDDVLLGANTDASHASSLGRNNVDNNNDAATFGNADNDLDDDLSRELQSMLEELDRAAAPCTGGARASHGGLSWKANNKRSNKNTKVSAEFTSWSVTATPTASLAAFSIAIRAKQISLFSEVPLRGDAQQLPVPRNSKYFSPPVDSDSDAENAGEATRLTEVSTNAGAAVGDGVGGTTFDSSALNDSHFSGLHLPSVPPSLLPPNSVQRNTSKAVGVAAQRAVLSVDFFQQQEHEQGRFWAMKLPGAAENPYCLPLAFKGNQRRVTNRYFYQQ